MIVLTALVGWSSLLAFAVFLFVGSLSLVDLGVSDAAGLVWNAFLCLAFFVQHSGMVRRSYRRWEARFVPSHYEGAVYTLASGIVLLALVVFWQPSMHTLASPDGMLRWLIRAGYFVAVVGFAWGARALGPFDPLGIEPILGRLRGTDPPSTPFTVRGPYRWVRHPLYFFVLLMIWSCPELTADRLLFNALFTAWIIVGTVLEERDLVCAFGEAYRDYERRVPMLIPWRKPKLDH